MTAIYVCFHCQITKCHSKIEQNIVICKTYLRSNKIYMLFSSFLLQFELSLICQFCLDIGQN